MAAVSYLLLYNNQIVAANGANKLHFAKLYSDMLLYTNSFTKNVPKMFINEQFYKSYLPYSDFYTIRRIVALTVHTIH